MRDIARVLAVSFAAAVLLAQGCARLKPVSAEAGSELAEPRKLFYEKRYTEALLKCNEIARQDPLVPGLPQLRQKILDSILDAREREAALRADSGYRRTALDVEQNKAVPETYGLRIPVRGEDKIETRPPTAIEDILDLPVSLYFTNLPLDSMVEEIGTAANINIIVDSSLAQSAAAGKTLSVHVSDVPLSELLDYVSRNLGVAFYAGKNILWVTPQSQAAAGVTVPMETRMYRLTKGLANLTMGTDSPGVDDDNNILRAIELFVPPSAGDGSAIFLDKNTHVLIVKDTRERLRQIEKIIETLDVTPPQILIEARFISTAVNDLRELGIDWSLQDPLAVSTKKILKNGEVVEMPRTQIEAGNVVNLGDFQNGSQGLNLTYQGVLTAPRYEAVLHALEKAEKTRTLSVPRITAANNFPANIHVGENFLYWTRFTTVSVNVGRDAQGYPIYQDSLIPDGDPTEKPLGITLDVTPTVGADMKAITLRLNPRIDQFVRYEEQLARLSNSADNNNNTNSASLLRLPIFREQSMDTKVVVQSGETVVLGGLITTVESKKAQKVPLLAAIPIVGSFFKHDSNDGASQNLLVFVTATIVSQRGESLIPVK